MRGSWVTITMVVSLVLIQVVENAHDLVAHLAVEVPGRLVREQDARAADDGAGDRDALLLAAESWVGK